MIQISFSFSFPFISFYFISFPFFSFLFSADFRKKKFYLNLGKEASRLISSRNRLFPIFPTPRFCSKRRGRRKIAEKNISTTYFPKEKSILFSYKNYQNPIFSLFCVLEKQKRLWFQKRNYHVGYPREIGYPQLLASDRGRISERNKHTDDIVFRKGKSGLQIVRESFPSH